MIFILFFVSIQNDFFNVFSKDIFEENSTQPNVITFFEKNAEKNLVLFLVDFFLENFCKSSYHSKPAFMNSFPREKKSCIFLKNYEVAIKMFIKLNFISMDVELCVFL